MPSPDFSSKLIRRHLSSDPVLADIIERLGPCTLTTVPTPPYRALCTAVVFQQLHGKAARTILGRICVLGGSKFFPSPDKLNQLSDAQLRGAGLSAAKTAAVRDIATKTRDKTIPSPRAIVNMTDDEIIARCTEARGVGRWTVEMMLMFRLGRPDILPVDDYGVRNGFRIAYKLKDMPTTKALAAHGERWKPWRTVASWYMWRVADAAKEAAVKPTKKPKV